MDCKLYWYPKLCFGSVNGSDINSVVELIIHREEGRGHWTVNYTGTQSYALVSERIIQKFSGGIICTQGGRERT